MIWVFKKCIYYLSRKSKVIRGHNLCKKRGILPEITFFFSHYGEFMHETWNAYRRQIGLVCCKMFAHLTKVKGHQEHGADSSFSFRLSFYAKGMSYGFTKMCPFLISLSVKYGSPIIVSVGAFLKREIFLKLWQIFSPISMSFRLGLAGMKKEYIVNLCSHP